MADEDLMSLSFENNPLSLELVDQDLDFTEFFNLDKETELLDENDTSEAQSSLVHQLSRPLQATTEQPDNFQKRKFELELELEETELRLKRNKLKQELLVLQSQNEAQVDSAPQAVSVPVSGVPHQAQDISTITTRWSDISHLSASGDFGPLDMDSAITSESGKLVRSDINASLQTITLIDQDERMPASWAENSNVYTSPSNPQISTPESSNLPKIHHDKNLRLPANLSRKIKRVASNEEDRRMSALRQKLSKSAVPDDFVNMFCQHSNPATKSKRTIAQKEKKKAIENRGGACLLCIFLQKGCDLELPCKECKRFIEKWQSRSTAFRWTCDVRTKLLDFNVFGLSTGTAHENLDYGLLCSTFKSIVDCNKINIDHLLNLMSINEPTRTRNVFPKNPSVHHSPIVSFYGMFSYLSSLRSVRAGLAYLVPELNQIFDDFEIVYNQVSMIVLSGLDKFWTAIPPLGASLCLASLFEDLRIFRQVFVGFEVGRVAHLEVIIQNYLQVLCSRISGNRKFKASGSKSLYSQYLTTALSQEDLATISSVFLGEPEGWEVPFYRCTSVLVKTRQLFETAANQKSCFFEHNEEVTSAPKSPCYCGWVVSCLSPVVLEIFSVSRKSIAKKVHQHSLQAEEVESWAEQSCGKFKGAMFHDRSTGELDKHMVCYFQLIFSMYWKLAIAQCSLFADEASYGVRPKRNSKFCIMLRQDILTFILLQTLDTLHCLWEAKDYVLSLKDQPFFLHLHDCNGPSAKKAASLFCKKLQGLHEHYILAELELDPQTC